MGIKTFLFLSTFNLVENLEEKINIIYLSHFHTVATTINPQILKNIYIYVLFEDNLDNFRLHACVVYFCVI